MRVLLLIPLLFLMPQMQPQTARDYYNEIYKAGGLDRMADGEVCFDDDPTMTYFFIFGQSKHMREFMMMDGTFAKLTKAQQEGLKKDFLIVRGYNKGIAMNEEEFFDMDGSSWISEAAPTPSDKAGRLLRIRITINWETLRFKRSVEILDRNSKYLSELAHFGRCEDVSPAVPQHAGPS